MKHVYLRRFSCSSEKVVSWGKVSWGEGGSRRETRLAGAGGRIRHQGAAFPLWSPEPGGLLLEESLALLVPRLYPVAAAASHTGAFRVYRHPHPPGPLVSTEECTFPCYFSGSLKKVNKIMPAGM